ncbi:hypothetical protein AVEN_259116-1 [Araneus ventricosus]|uniref:Mos1 transposase HTH domain-containing protein n=1 Tax=Araneus ventricosus TaxID=182803 RepID=A0A4Y2LCL1_ARAVE|nr:hypothetical protein AVEN_259116-1 [Araneus ventricosus]
MATLTDIWSAIKVRILIRFLRLKETSPVHIHRQLVEVYGASVLPRKQVWFWYKEFELGRTDVRDLQMARAAKHVQHSLDLAPSDIRQYGLLKKHLAGFHFRTSAEVQEAVVKWLLALISSMPVSIDWFTDGINASTTMVDYAEK